MRRLFSSIYPRDPSARHWLEIILTFAGVQAVFFYRISHFFWNIRLKLLARIIAYLARIITGVEIHPAATIGKLLFIDHGIGVVIGETAVIGDHVTIYHGVTLGGTSTRKGHRHPNIGDNVVIGAGAKILGPITIGEGARIGSNAVVLENIPPHTSAVGIPARVVTSHKHRTRVDGFVPYGSQATSCDDPIHDEIEELSLKLEALKNSITATKGKKFS